MYRQGSLDTLCGVYAVINSTRAVADTYRVRLTRKQCSELFRKLCDVLADGGRLADALTEGTTITTFQSMTRHAHEWLESERGLKLTSRRAFRSAPDGLDTYWRTLESHAAEFGAGSVLVGLCGRLDHWTCVRSVNERAITLVDSDGVKILRRDRCTISDPDRRRIHQLVPTQTILITGPS